MDNFAENTAQLLDRLKEDKDGVFTSLVGRYHHGLVAVATTMLGAGEAEDAVQSAWISAYGAIERFEGRSSIRTWLYRIVVNEARMRLRRGGREVSLTVDTDEADALSDRFRADGHWEPGPRRWDWTSPEELLQEQDLLDCLRKHLGRLPESQRLVVLLRDVQGLEFDDICNTLELEASNVRVLLHRGRVTLFRMVDDYQETGKC